MERWITGAHLGGAASAARPDADTDQYIDGTLSRRRPLLSFLRRSGFGSPLLYLVRPGDRRGIRLADPGGRARDGGVDAAQG